MSNKVLFRSFQSHSRGSFNRRSRRFESTCWVRARA